MSGDGARMWRLAARMHEISCMDRTCAYHHAANVAGEALRDFVAASKTSGQSRPAEGATMKKKAAAKKSTKSATKTKTVKRAPAKTAKRAAKGGSRK